MAVLAIAGMTGWSIFVLAATSGVATKPNLDSSSPAL